MSHTIAAFAELKKLVATPELPDIGPTVRTSARSIPESNRLVDDYLRNAGLPTRVHPLIRSAVLLWNDHLDASHTLSQDIHSQDGSFLHGIMHRREPDYGNAKYWFHRVGVHPAFERLAERAAQKLDRAGQAQLKGQLVPGGRWDPFAFVDACEQARRGPDDLRRLLSELQQLEFEALLEYWCEAA